MKKEDAILSFHAGEFGWEILRTAPHIIWYKKQNPNAKLIVCTREDRYDLYGKYANIYEPLKIEGDGSEYKGNCFTLTNFPESEYYALSQNFRKKFERKFNILKYICPEVKNKQFTRKDQFNAKQMIYDFEPRKENKLLIDSMCLDEKPIVVLAPRYRKGFPRNWNHWETLYDLIHKNEFLNNFNFVLCGKSPDYISDKYNRFFDINKVMLTTNTSLVGITIEVIKRSVLVCGSQSGIPNLSNLIGTPTLQWGHQEWFHSKTYNVKNTKTKFISCKTKNDFNTISPKVIFKELKDQLRGKEIKK